MSSLDELFDSIVDMLNFNTIEGENNEVLLNINDETKLVDNSEQFMKNKLANDLINNFVNSNFIKSENKKIKEVKINQEPFGNITSIARLILHKIIDFKKCDENDLNRYKIAIKIMQYKQDADINCDKKYKNQFSQFFKACMTMEIYETYLSTIF